MIKLTIELVPKTSWYNNVRSKISKSEWDVIRNLSYKLAGHKCEICSATGRMECHEIWEYNETDLIQRLTGFVCLCKDCHRVKHPGLAKLKGEELLVEQQLMKVNNMTEYEAINYLMESFKTWENRNRYKWMIDISYVNEYLQLNSGKL